MKNNKIFKQQCFLVVLGVVLFWGLTNYSVVFNVVSFVLDVLTPVIVGACMAFILNVPLSAFEKRVLRADDNGVCKNKVINKIKRPLSIIMTFLVCFGVLCLVCYLVIPALIATFQKLTVDIPVFITNVGHKINNTPTLQKWLDNMNLNQDELLDKVKSTLSDGVLVLKTVNSTLSVATTLFSGLLNFLLGIFFAIYILAQKEKLKDQSCRILGAFMQESKVKRITNVCSISNDTFSRFLVGQCTEALILGSLCCIGMLIFHFDNAVIIGILVAVTAFIPIIGAFMGIFVGAFLICVTDFNQAIWFVVFMLILQQIEGNLIYPRVVGQSVGLPSLWVLFSVTVGGSLGGIFGMFIAVPVCSVLYCMLRESVNYRNERKRRRRQIVEDASVFVNQAEDKTE